MPGVLAVDDEPGFLKSMSRLLRPSGRHIFTADSGASAISLLEQHADSIGVVVTDYTMPGMNGAELLGVVRLRWPDITRVLLTGNADMASAAAAVNEGGLSSLFTKPVQPEEFRQAITQSLAHHSSLMETRRLRTIADEQAARLELWNARLETLISERTQELERANVGLRRGMLETVRLLLVLLQQRLPHRTAHYKAVARLAGRLAERAQQPAEKVRAIQAAALIHDIGLVSLPDLLLRPGLVPMTRRVEYERHAILGQQMLSSVDELGEMAGWIRHHHERWDGAGYPDRLAGPAIPFPSQIIAIAAGFNDALAREGGSAASWRWTQTEAGEFDPLLIEYLDDEISARPNPSSLDTEAGSSNLRPTSQSAPGVSPGGLIHSARSAQESNEFDFSVMPMRRLRSGMVLAESISTPAGITLLRMGETLTDSQIERLRRLVTEGKVNDDEMVSVLIR
ncbi:MAG TPA: HD domain-containing phosphohydrolase [Chloroflexota bacterium]|nr:HD domain-containing phosphohydrolase [Chloroflexota bacterium]